MSCVMSVRLPSTAPSTGGSIVGGSCSGPDSNSGPGSGS